MMPPMPRSTIPPLSKSRFTSGLQCHLRLYLQSYERKLASAPDAALRARFAAGTRAGAIAQGLRPGGVLVDEPAFHHDQAVTRTRELLTQVDVPAIYEAAFTEDDVRIRVDILARTTGDAWELIEVKSSTSQKAEHIPDVAVQLVTLDHAGITVERAGVGHINRDYVHAGGPYIVDELFVVADVTDEARQYAKQVAEEIAAMRAALAADVPPDIDIGPHCTRPYDCDFIAYCRRDEPEWSIDEIPRLKADRIQAFRASGVRSILEIPASERLTPTQEIVRQAVTTGEPRIGAGLRGALDGIVAPAHFIDFETMAPALPTYAGTRPYEMLTFQWSDHVLSADGDLTHEEFLATGDDDPRREFAETLIAQLAGAATIIVYSGFEQARLKQLAEAIPDLRPELEAILAMSWVDLLQVVRSEYYHPNFHGSFSIKSVLPALVPEYGYGDLEIQEGELASLAFIEIVDPETSDQRREQLRTDLLAYCGRDTEAMVRIVEALRASL
jgi:predicted RecB family nuclease